MWTALKNLWNKLPKEVKVALFIAVSYGLSELAIELSKIEVSNVWLAIVINIFLVFLKELKPRAVKLKKK